MGDKEGDNLELQNLLRVNREEKDDVNREKEVRATAEGKLVP